MANGVFAASKHANDVVHDAAYLYYLSGVANLVEAGDVWPIHTTDPSSSRWFDTWVSWIP